LTMGSGDNEVSNTGISTTVAGGDKLRFYITALGTALCWTITLELSHA